MKEFINMRDARIANIALHGRNNKNKDSVKERWQVEAPEDFRSKCWRHGG
jgi:hypothetical protein